MSDAKNFDLQIIRPDKNHNFRVEWIDAQGVAGDFLIGPDHYPLVSILKERGRLLYKEVGVLHPKSIDVYGGVLKVENNEALVILDL